MEEELDILDEDTQKDRYMIFRIGTEEYGIDISFVNEIIGLQRITNVPETEEYVRGLINLRGKIIPVIDVRLRFGKPLVDYHDRTCIIIITVDKMMVGLIVDAVAEVAVIGEDEISEPPSIGVFPDYKRFIYGIGKTENGVRLLLDPERLLYEKERQILNSIS